jgi:hypothetical protein
LDNRRFDTLAKTLAGATPRRGLLRLAAALALAGLAPPIGESAAEGGAGGRPGGKRHGRNRGHHPGKDKRKRKGKGRAPGASGGRCVGLGQLCTPLVGDPCCQIGSLGKTECRVTLNPLVTTCQFACSNDGACLVRWGPDTVCSRDLGNCPSLVSNNPDDKCCVARHCSSNGDCHSGLCCPSALDTGTCCLPGQRCDQVLGCLGTPTYP